MAYYKFQRNDKFTNTLKLFPEVNFTFYNGSIYHNNIPNFSGSFTGSIVTPTQGSLSLYELNVDREYNTNLTAPGLGPDWSTPRTIPPAGGPPVTDYGTIYPWIVKTGDRLNFRTSTSEAFVDLNYGDVIEGSYPLSASIVKEWWCATGCPRVISASICGGTANPCDPDLGFVEIENSGSVSHLMALKNTINYYQYLSPHFQYESDTNMVTAGIHDRDFDACDLGLLQIPSIFYGSQIKKGTVQLDMYYTGSLVATAKDTKRNGELVQTYPATVGNVVGLVLYNEGFIILTGSEALTAGEDTDTYITDDGEVFLNWTYFGTAAQVSQPGLDDDSLPNAAAPNTLFKLSMSGTTNTQVLTMFATAPKGQLNHSNNPSYLKNISGYQISTGSQGYIESDQIRIKNVVSSAYNSPTGSFEKLTYISTIGIYDKDKNLIGVAKTATPVKKEINRDFTFKLRLDI